MSIITKIEEQKNKSRVNVFVDGTFFCGLNKEVAVLFRLKENKEVDEDRLKKAIFESEVKTAFEKSLNYLSRQMQTKKKLTDKLIQKGFSEESIRQAVKKLEDYHYLDDRLYTKQFIQQNQLKSKRILKQKLHEKGISKDVIDDILAEERVDDEYEICLIQAKKYIKNKEIINSKDLQKFYASLARKGFNFDVIKKAVKTAINKDLEDENNFD